MQLKRFVLSALAFAVALLVVSCRPLSAAAVDISVGDQTQIHDYLDASEQGLINIDFALDQDEDGNRSTRLKIYGLQQLALQSQSDFYSGLDFSASPSTVSVSGSGGSGLFKFNNQYYSCCLYNNSYTLATSELFNIVVQTSLNYSVLPFSFSSTSGAYGLTLGYNSAQNSSNTFAVDTMHFFSGNSPALYFGDPTFVCHCSSSFIPDFSGNPLNLTYVVGRNNLPDRDICGNYVDISLPPATVDTITPWDYYNDTLLPYIHNEFGGNYDDYLVFPQGYQPPAQPTTVPIEYPTIPGFDYALETNGTEPASDYNYNLPELPTKEIAVPQFDFTTINPAEIMAPIASGLSGIWSLITDICTEFSLFPYVGLAVLCAIVFTLLHLGK